MLETKETKQTDSQLCFAPKNIKIDLVVFENEFFEVAWLVSKKFQKLKYTHIMPTWSYLSVKDPVHYAGFKDLAGIRSSYFTAP